MIAAALDAAPAPGPDASLFTADWLTLREPLDRSARAVALVHRLADLLPRDRGLSVVDLGCGTGANLRTLAPCLPVPQTWRCIDRDPLLLRELPNRTRPWAEAAGLVQRWEDGDETILSLDAPEGFRYRVELELRDLAATVDDLDFSGVDVVTCSALVDLVSAEWLAVVAQRAVQAGAMVLAALTVTGEVAFLPEDPLDAEVLALVRRHQTGDKGFGPALGPAAPQAMADVFQALGYQVATQPSDWDAGPETVRLQRAVIEDHARAAAAMAAPDRQDAVAAWREARLLAAERGRGRLRIGHLDLLAHP